jgi:hypothetical protein
MQRVTGKLAPLLRNEDPRVALATLEALSHAGPLDPSLREPIRQLARDNTPNGPFAFFSPAKKLSEHSPAIAKLGNGLLAT